MNEHDPIAEKWNRKWQNREIAWTREALVKAVAEARADERKKWERECVQLTELRAELAQAQKALHTAYNLIISHHGAGYACRPGMFCPVCHHKDGTEPEMDEIARALATAPAKPKGPFGPNCQDWEKVMDEWHHREPEGGYFPTTYVLTRHYTHCPFCGNARVKDQL